MSEKTFTRWTCRRCGHIIELVGHDQPSYWVRIGRAMPPRHADPINMGDLCGTCWGVVQAVLNDGGAPLVAVVPPAPTATNEEPQ